MATIKSSSSNLILNADGIGKDNIFKSNDSQIGSLSDVGILAVTSLAGDGSALTGLSTSLSELSDYTISASDPATDSNPSATGHVWVNSTSGEVFVSTDVTTDSNVWTNFGGGSGDVAPVVWYGGRGVWAGGYVSGRINVIQYIAIDTTGNATDFGDLLTVKSKSGAVSNGPRGVWAGGEAAATTTNVIEYITISTTGNSTDFGDLSTVRMSGAACSDGSRGIFGAHWDGSDDTMDYITIATTGNATDFGNMLSSLNAVNACCNDATRGVWAAGGYPRHNIMQYITIQTTGNATDFGDLTDINETLGGTDNGSRGVFAGGRNNSVDLNVIQYITIQTTGNSTDFGDLTGIRGWTTGVTSNGNRGVIGGGYTSNVIDYITISTTGNATDFGDLLQASYGSTACSGD
jgi:hypothetical protein